MLLIANDARAKGDYVESGFQLYMNLEMGRWVTRLSPTVLGQNNSRLSQELYRGSLIIAHSHPGVDFAPVLQDHDSREFDRFPSHTHIVYGNAGLSVRFPNGTIYNLARYGGCR